MCSRVGVMCLGNPRPLPLLGAEARGWYGICGNAAGARGRERGGHKLCFYDTYPASSGTCGRPPTHAGAVINPSSEKVCILHSGRSNWKTFSPFRLLRLLLADSRLGTKTVEKGNTIEKQCELSSSVAYFRIPHFRVAARNFKIRFFVTVLIRYA